jgi:hypothetical protein
MTDHEPLVRAEAIPRRRCRLTDGRHDDERPRCCSTLRAAPSAAGGERVARAAALSTLPISILAGSDLEDTSGVRATVEWAGPRPTIGGGGSAHWRAWRRGCRRRARRLINQPGRLGLHGSGGAPAQSRPELPARRTHSMRRSDRLFSHLLALAAAAAKPRHREGRSRGGARAAGYRVGTAKACTCSPDAGGAWSVRSSPVPGTPVRHRPARDGDKKRLMPSPIPRTARPVKRVSPVGGRPAGTSVARAFTARGGGRAGRRHIGIGRG